MLPRGRLLATDKVMVGIILIAPAGVAKTQLLRRIEKRFERWRPTIGG
jgi:ABC-type nitrate/sulfonate/bicarbonate transport system permease component